VTGCGACVEAPQDLYRNRGGRGAPGRPAGDSPRGFSRMLADPPSGRRRASVVPGSVSRSRAS